MRASGYYVWNPDQNKPSYQHDSEDAAIAEAERLAQLHSGSEFIVLRSIGSAKRTKPAPFVFDENVLRERNRDLPF